MSYNYGYNSDVPVLVPVHQLKMAHPQPAPATCYMILKQEGNEARGAPVAMFSDPFKARAVFDGIPNNIVGAFTGGGGSHQLVAYGVDAYGTLMELQLIGMK